MYSVGAHRGALMPEGLHRFCRLAAGGAHSLVVTERAEVLAWGSNSHGQVGNDTTEDIIC